ncbi:MAG: S41 family peptidase [Defluviitaleaceae bacterium]|nr:S41 family peptidase [Defluviitaleaceae bacterium]
MKVIFIVALVFILSACGRGAEYNYEYVPESPTPIITEATPEPTPERCDFLPEPSPTPKAAIRLIPDEEPYIPLIPRWVEGDTFVTQHFLCDFDYLMHMLRINFPLFGPAYRGHGINIDLIEEATRQAILQSNITSPQEFSNMLARYFFEPFGGFGHLYQHWERRLHLVLANIYRDSIDEHGNFIHAYSQRIYEAMRHPAVTRFYGNIQVNLGQYETGMLTPNNITTEILVEGEIAYMNIHRFNHYNIHHDSEIIFAFYEEIAGFDHLIIDLQQNLGGFPDYFFQLIVAPNLTTPLEGRIYEFFPAGYNNRLFADALIHDILSDDPNSITLYYNAQAFTQENNMPYFNQEDLKLLHNVIAWDIGMTPVVGKLAFNGRIWMLIGPGSQSATEVAAIFARETGFATLVGQPTAGIMGAISAYLVLPNSGILVRYDLGYMTDSYGRSFEEFGVMPHYVSPQVMSALETVLTLIENESYSNSPFKQFRPSRK